MKFLEKIRDTLACMPLSRRMVMMLLFMMAAALTVAGTLMIGMLQRQLIAQVDQQLVASAKQLAASAAAASEQLHDVTTAIPSDYYVRSVLFDSEGVATQGFEFLTEGTYLRAGYPELDGLESADQVQDALSVPVTVSSSVSGATWRMVTTPIVYRGMTISQVIGYLTVGLPLVDVTETLRSTTYAFSLSVLSLLLVSAIIGFYLVRKSLRPLKTIEAVAGRIAAGDLSRRIPPSPPSTEVGALSLSLNKMLGQIEESFAAQRASEAKQRQFVSDASHELRTPLAAIRGYAELYRMGAIPEPGVADAMERIESEATRLGALVESLLALARIDEGRPLEITDVDLVELAKNSRSDLRALDNQRRIQICGLGGKRMPSSILLQADRNQLTQVFVNLAGNIARYTPRGTPVEIALGVVEQGALPVFQQSGGSIGTGSSTAGVADAASTTEASASIRAGAAGAASGAAGAAETSAGAANTGAADSNAGNAVGGISVPGSVPARPVEGYAGQYAVVEFRDHGPGIPVEEQSRVFERFYRTDKSRSRAMGGSGLGLSIVASIVKAHGGQVWMSTTEPHGLTVHLAFPLEAVPSETAPLG